jgi:predicted DNA-binding transcriptional regulator YafY
MKLDRLLSIIILLLNKDRASARELAERFDVTERTIYRDLEAIDAAGIPVVSQPGPGGGYGIDPDYTIDRRLLSFGDLSAMVAALKGVNEAIGDSSLGSALEKISSMVKRGPSRESLEERVVIDLFPWGKREEERALAKIAERAIAERRVLRFLYSSYGREREERAVEPMTLVFKSYAWYLWGFCRLRQDFRLFKLARMRDVKASMERFKRRAGAYQPDAVPGPTEHVNVRLRFEAARFSEVEEWFPADDVRPQDDGGVIVSMRVPGGDWFVNTLLGFGPGAEVLEPEYFREKVAAAAEKIAASNQNPKKP